MSPTRTTFWLLIALIGVFGFQKAIVTPLDPDLFWHLRVAEQLQTEGIHPIVDHISFSSRTDPWTPYSWLAELAMKLVWDTTGYRGTILLQGLVCAAIIFFIARACLEMTRASERLMNCLLAVILAAYLILPYISFRPVTIAILLLTIVTWLLLRDRRLDHRSRALWLVVPITVLLANVHLVVIMVPIWVGALAVGLMLERKPSRRYWILLALTALACLATPLLPGVLRTAMHYQRADVMVNSNAIGEMNPIYKGLPGIITCSIIGLLLLWAVLRSRQSQIGIGEWLWLLVAMALMLRLGKFIPMFAMIAAPVLAAALPAMKDVVLTKRPIRVALVLVLLIGVGKLAWTFPRPSKSLDDFINGDDFIAYPAKAAAYVEQNINPRTHRLINEFTWGGYLGWRLRDRYQVFLDGRTQVFPQSFWQATYLGSDDDIKDVLVKANADVAIVPTKKSRFTEPLKALGWKSVYSDDRAQVFVPPS